MQITSNLCTAGVRLVVNFQAPVLFTAPRLLFWRRARYRLPFRATWRRAPSPPGSRSIISQGGDRRRAAKCHGSSGHVTRAWKSIRGGVVPADGGVHVGTLDGGRGTEEPRDARPAICDSAAIKSLILILIMFSSTTRVII